MNSATRPAILNGLPVRPKGPPDWPRPDPLVQTVFERLVKTGDWGRYHGPHGTELCQQLAHYHSLEQVLLCSSGTAAMELVLRGLNISPGDEVILAGYDFKANFQNVLCVQAIPVLIDLSPTTWQLDPTRIDPAISAKTRAIIVSHLHGGVVAMPHILQIAKAHGIAVIEDACQNPGAMIHGRRSGTWGDVGILSFGGSKLLTAGRGGAVLTNRADVAERIKRYVQRGNDAYPLSEMQSAILVPQLGQLDAFNQRRSQSVQDLCRQLSDFPGLTVLQPPTGDVQPAYYKVGLQYRSECWAGLTRDGFAASLRAEGIAIDPGFRGLHLIHASRRFRPADSLQEATQADAGMLTLHHPVLLEGTSAIAEIVTAIHKIHAHAAEIAATAPTCD